MGVGRPKKEVDEKVLHELASIGCTMKEMSAVLGVSTDTLERNYALLIDSGREHGKRSVRRIMWKQAEQGNSVALKYLVHNVLKEAIELDPNKDLNDQTNELMGKLNSISTDMILKLVQKEGQSA